MPGLREPVAAQPFLAWFDSLAARLDTEEAAREMIGWGGDTGARRMHRLRNERSTDMMERTTAENAIHAAGLLWHDVYPDEQTGVPEVHADLIAAANRWEQETGVMPSEMDWNPASRRKNMSNMLTRIRQHRDTLKRYDEGDFPSAFTVKKHFGSWNAFIAACGREPRSPGRPAIHTTVKPETPNLEQVRRRVGELDTDSPVPRAYGRNVMARLVRAVLDADKAHDLESLQAILIDGAAELVAWADRLTAEIESKKAA